MNSVPSTTDRLCYAPGVRGATRSGHMKKATRRAAFGEASSGGVRAWQNEPRYNTPRNRSARPAFQPCSAPPFHRVYLWPPPLSTAITLINQHANIRACFRTARGGCASGSARRRYPLGGGIMHPGRWERGLARAKPPFRLLCAAKTQNLTQNSAIRGLIFPYRMAKLSSVSVSTRFLRVLTNKEQISGRYEAYEDQAFGRPRGH